MLKSEVSFSNLVDVWIEWEGTARGGGCRVSLGDEVASTVLDWAVLTHKKRLRGAANYRLNFLDIFVFFFPPPLWLHPSEVLPSKKGTASWPPPQLSGLCHCDSHSGAALRLVVGRAALASTRQTLMEKGCI